MLQDQDICGCLLSRKHNNNDGSFEGSLSIMKESNNGYLNSVVRLRDITRGSILRVLDLFAGCGGLSLGFQHAGFQIVGSVEKDPKAALSQDRKSVV